jgi:nucleotide-binding universal stress UspA family protein
MYARILVPVDGSETSRRGLEEAIALAGELKSTLRLLHVTSDFPMMLEMANAIDFEKYREGLHQYGRDLMEESRRMAERAGIAAEVELRDVRNGRVAEVIVDEAVTSKCDLVIIGTHGRRGFNRLVVGSDAEAVVRASPVPVLLVRAPGAKT